MEVGFGFALLFANPLVPLIILILTVPWSAKYLDIAPSKWELMGLVSCGVVVNGIIVVRMDWIAGVCYFGACVLLV